MPRQPLSAPDEARIRRKIKAIEIFNIAVLRARIEEKDAGFYFGSLIGLKHWIQQTYDLGWIDVKGRPTALGRALANSIPFEQYGSGRAYLWPNMKDLERKVKALSWYYVKKAYTPWTPINIPPTIPGRYQVQEKSMGCSCCWIDLEYRGGSWYGPASPYPSPDKSDPVFTRLVFTNSLKRWRGLRINPEMK